MHFEQAHMQDGYDSLDIILKTCICRKRSVKWVKKIVVCAEKDRIRW